MLFVFQVDAGRMMTFDMTLTMESVTTLKLFVEDAFKIPVEKQVLLISGGEYLDPNKRVCSYSAGTDTNPIFLFSKSVIESPVPPYASVDYGSEGDLREKLRDCSDLPAALSTVTRRTQLAQQFYELAMEQTRICETLVHDQHMQQQGWSAVVANLEDITADFKKRADIFENSFTQFMAEREFYIEFLTHFNEDLLVLQKIPVLPPLLDIEKQNLEMEVANLNMSQERKNPKEISLFEWIWATDNKESLEQLYEQSSKGLEQFDLEILTSLKEEITVMLDSANNLKMKEVKGLGERLSGLENLMRAAKKCVQQQADVAQSFLKNQSRAINLQDQSFLPDLCASHKNQLKLIAENHKQIYDIRRRCIKAKEELSLNLYHRLRWVMYIEDCIMELDQKLFIYHENLKRLQFNFELLQQIHLAPASYLSAVAEVVRRRAFSQSFLLWASELACHLLTIHNEEVTRRKEFKAQFDGNFLNSLFPGMEDLPPPFATQPPSMFDCRLPKIMLEDVEKLKKELPEFGENLNIPDISAITNFFLIRSIIKKEEERVDEAKAVEEKFVQADTDVGLASNLDDNLLKATGSEVCAVTAHGLPHLKDLDKGCESETDTEEFEKVGQSPLELHFDKQIPSSRPGTQDVATSMEVGERSPLPPKKPPRVFQKSHLSSVDDSFHSLHRTLSVSSTPSNTESFTNIKNPSLESIDELSSLKNLTSNTESCFNSHYQQLQGNSSNLFVYTKSISPHTPQSPRDVQANSPNSPILGHQPSNDFINDEFYIDESLPSSLSIETGNSQGEFVKQLDTANNVVALLQDNLQISRSEHEKLKSTLVKMHYLAKQATVELRSELNDMKTQVLSGKNIFGQHCEILNKSWENLLIEWSNKEKETVDNLTKDFQITIADFKEIEKTKNEQIETLLQEKNALEVEVLRSCENLNDLQGNFSKVSKENKKIIEELEVQLQEKELEKEKNIKEITDRLNREHKAELENIRSRFKLMTMERSPSDTSLEKSGDFSSLPSHTTLLLQMTENFELDKEKAVNEAIQKEKEKWEKLLNEKVVEMEMKFTQEKELLLQDIVKKISDEKDKQIDVLREREKNLNLECLKYKSTIQQLAECESGSNDSDLLEKINILQKDKEKLEEEIERIKNEKTADLAASVAIYDGKVDATTSPIRQRESLSKSEISTTKSGKLNIESCKAGDQVLVLWDAIHESFKILQENKHMYFLHSDYLEVLGLEVVDGKPNKNYCTGEVIDKEYCHARKSENRYKVPKGTKFFRVKVKPLVLATPSKDVTQSLYHPKSATVDISAMSQSQSTISTIPEIIPEEKATSHSLPSSPSREHPVILEKCEENDESDGITSEIVKPDSAEKNFAEDSGIVDTIEQATAITDETIIAENRDESESSDR